MKLLKFWSDSHRETPIDVFIDEPFDFQEALEEADVRQAGKDLEIRIVSLKTLFAMKEKAGRPLDLADIDELNLLHNKPSSYDREN